MVFRLRTKRERMERDIKRSNRKYCEDECIIENCKDCDRDFMTVDDALEIKGDIECHEDR